MMNRPAEGDAGPDIRLRTMRVLWAVFLLNVGMFVIIARLIHPEVGLAGAVEAGVPPLLRVLAFVGLSAVAASFLLKAVFFRRGAERREPMQVQTGLILALALCESAALMGMVGLFVTASGYAYLLFALGALGMAMHYPRREPLEAAYFKSLM